MCAVRRRRFPIYLAALFWLATAGAPFDLRAQQPLSVQPQRNLDFGDVIAGIPTSVSRLDNQRSGMYEVRGQRNAEVALTFTLPPDLVGVGGATMPVEFGADDAGFSRVPAQGNSVGFDPRVSFSSRLSASGRGYVWLGGTVRPARNQASGAYRAPVTLTVGYTGN